ncbi:MAG: hypothetical protein KJ852_00690 [Gammaproteobacteria bacterium]|nr:hypothetical protein [Gammaproteobacteria bacterium]MBU0788067.1 hypothetical protein [Gammaproteobacteria bacterium]MBU0815435.1 hypothetical protein [Gammaproteobacteria bacterium]MBU1785457.1 hypothetical protein [Gammaproteobacteria bacterium]
MKVNKLLILSMMLVLVGCSFVSGQLADKASEERLQKPGALDKPMTGYFDTYIVNFLNRYRITHDWPVVSNCSYRKLPTLNSPDRYKGEVYAVRDIYEDRGKTWQRFNPPLQPYDFDRFVRSQKKQQPVYDKATVIRYEEAEVGLKPLCFEAWVGTDHALTLMLYRRTLEEWPDAMFRRNHGTYLGTDAVTSIEEVNGNRWQVYRVGLKQPVNNNIAGPFEFRILALGNTGYTLAMELAANQNSLKHPQAHAKMQAMFQHLIESVKVEPLTPSIAAEMELLKARANEVERQECIDMAKRTKPFTWCEKYLH